MIEDIEAAKAIGEHRTDEIVVNTMRAGRLWILVSKRAELDLPLTGCMSKASSLALGVALARPDKRVMVLDGDGSLLMNLGSLVTIANQAPPNFIHFVFENDIYWVTGGQPIPGAGKFSFASLAKASGYRNAYEFDDLESLKLSLERIFREPGPTFVCLKVFSNLDDRLPYPARKTEDAVPDVKEYLKKVSTGA